VSLRFLAAGAAALAFVTAAAAAPVPALEPGDMALGRAAAPVTIVEYASLGCPHCADWDRDVFPEVKAKLIDTGQARYVLREMLNGDPTVATGGFMVARCAGPQKYFAVVEAVFRRQGEMFEGRAGLVLREIAVQTGGLASASFDACLADPKGLDALTARVRQHGDDKVEITPTFIIGAAKLEGYQTFAQIAQAVTAARRPR
jgi:protein-disulfide isomerase